MDLTAFARMLARRGWIALAMAALGAGAGLALAATRTVVYEAETRMAVRPARPADLGQTQAIREIMRSYSRDLATYDMAAAAAAQLGAAWMAEHGLDADALYPMIHIGTDENVYELRVAARHSDPDIARAVSEKWAIAFEDRREKANLQLLLADRVLVTRRDDTQLRVHSPRRRLFTAAGGAAGLALGAALVLALEFVEHAVVLGSRDAARVAGAPVLGQVPPRRGARPSTALREGLGDAWRATRRAARSAWPIAALALLGAASALAFSRVQPTVWRARTRIAVEPARGSDWGQTQAIPEVMKGYAEDIRTRRMAAAVDAALELDLPPDALIEKLNVAPREADYEIWVDLRDPDRDTALAISRAWAERFVEERIRANLALDQSDRILVRLRDRPAAAIYTPRTLANVLAGTVLGALSGVAVVVAAALARAGIVAGGRDAAEAAAAPLLGAIPPRRSSRRARQAGGFRA